MISIIIPVYNIEQYLIRCLESVIKQSYQEFEIILVDDGSTDTSAVICEEYANMDSRITTWHIQNGGVCRARNLGLKAANGEFITFIDGDDVISPKMLDVLLFNAKKYDVGLSVCGLSFIENRNVEKEIQFETGGSEEAYLIERRDLVNGFFTDSTIKKIMYGPYNKLLSRDIAQKNSFNTDLTIGEDLLYCFECLKNIEVAVIQKIPLYYYIKRPLSATTSSFSEKKLDYLLAAKRILQECRELYPDCVEDAERWYYINILNHMRLLSGYPKNKKRQIELYRNSLSYLKNNRYRMNLDSKQRISYFLLMHFSWLFFILKKIGYPI